MKGRISIVGMKKAMDDFIQLQKNSMHAAVQKSSGKELSGMPKRIDRIGRQVGNYRLIQLLEKGGFAEIYLGEHVYLNTYAAIKILYAQLAAEDLESFHQEARIVASLRHPHIISVLDFDVQDGTPFLVMDYAPHGTLRQRHPGGTVVLPTTIISYILQIADALQYAHDRHLIHRDVKPGNMLIGWRDEILLSDFGIAVVSQTSHTDVKYDVMGTLPYMSPEQFAGNVLQASDQYSLGVVVYEWLCGKVPFHGPIVEVASQHMKVAPPSLCERNPEISPALEAVVFKALAKDPAQRYPNVSDFARAFVDACPQGPVLLHDATFEKSQYTPPLEHYEADTVRANFFDGIAKQNSLIRRKRSRSSFSRRTVLISFVGLASLGVLGSSIIWYEGKHSSRMSPVLQTPPNTLTGPGTVLILYRGHTDVVNAAAWLPDSGTYIASASRDHTVRVWYTSSGADARNYLGHSDMVNAVAWSPDGLRIASASNDRTVHVWSSLEDIDPVIIYGNHTDIVNTVSWSPDGQQIASGGNDRTVHIWRPGNSRDVAIYRQHTDIVRTVAWSPDGKYIASAGADNTVRVWEPMSAANIVTFRGHSDVVNAVAWSSDSQYLASASADRTVQVWYAILGGNPLMNYTMHTGSVNAVAWSSDGKRIASASDDGTVREWNFGDGSEMFVYNGHAPNAVRDVMWSPDGINLASAGADRTVQIWQE